MHAPLSLPKKYLLSKNWEYRHIYRTGKRLHGDNLTLIYAPNGKSNNRLGISVSGVKGAVKRNRIKRLIREFYRLNRSRSFLSGQAVDSSSMDVIFAVRKGFNPENPTAVRTTVDSLVNKGAVG